ncbi:MAG: glycosyltransferase [Candidatus Binatia bacterium]
MEPMPFVSLILCCKNGMPYLRDAVESVASQSYPYFELVVQDGGSTDGTLKFLKAIRGIGNIDIQSAQDKGVGQARNRAIRRCKGDIVGSIDADNVLEKEALSSLVDIFQRYASCAAIYGGSRIIDSEGRDIDTFIPGPFDFLRVMGCELVPPFATSFFSRRVCGDELYFDESLKTCEDFDLWLRIGHLPIAMVPCVLGRTRIHDKSTTAQPDLYDQHVRAKIGALERYLKRYDWSVVIETLYRRSVAGIYLWAAESVYNLEGCSDRFNQFCDMAASFDPLSDRLRRILSEVEKPSEVKSLKLRKWWNRIVTQSITD